MLYELNAYRRKLQRNVKDVETIKAIRKLERKYQELLELKTKRRIDLVDNGYNPSSYNMEYGFLTNPSGNVTVMECILCLANDGYEIKDIEANTRTLFFSYMLELSDIINNKSRVL